MKELFQPIADAIVSSTSKEWREASLIILVLGASVRYNLKFSYADETTDGEFLNAPGDLSDLIRKVHADMNNESPKHWNKILFNLNSEGKFNLEFKWDQDKQDQFEEDSRI